MLLALGDEEKFNGLPTGIPALQELIARRQWVAWRYLESDGKITKPPVNPHNGYGASHSDPATWGSYEEAKNWAIQHNLPGIGYVMSHDDDFTGTDLDDCRDPEFGGIEEWAQKIVELSETYTEVSPSGKGLRLIWRGKIDKSIKCDPAHVEVYRDKRYLTITGNHIKGTPTVIRPAPATEAFLRQRVKSFKPDPVAAPPPRKGGIISEALNKLGGASKSGNNFFSTVNTMSLARLDQWVPDLFGSLAEFQPGTGAWRISSKNLGRNLQEDLSIAPNGIVDWGVHDIGDPKLGKRSPIALVLEYGTHKNAVEVSHWLCSRMGIAPASIGWNERKPEPDPFLGAKEAPQPEQAAANDNTARFIFEKIGDLRKLPPLQFLVKGWVPVGALGILYGKWAGGKSFIANDLALHLAYGMSSWHGAELPGRPVHVLVIAREGHQGFVHRIDAFKRFHKLVDDSDHITFMRGSVSFMRDEDFSELCNAIKADQTPYEMVIVDTVARVLPGVDINEPAVVTLFMERIAILGQLTGAATIGVHHQNKAGTMMGSIFFEANSDFIFEVTRHGEEDGPLTSGEIVCTKMKDGEDRWKRSVAYEKIQLSIAPDGPSSLVVSQIGEPPRAAKKGSGWPDAHVCNRVQHFIREAWDSGAPLSTAAITRRDGRYAPQVIAKHFGLSARIADEMVCAWLDERPPMLVIEEVDKKSKLKGLKIVGQIGPTGSNATG